MKSNQEETSKRVIREMRQNLYYDVVLTEVSGKL